MSEHGTKALPEVPSLLPMEAYPKTPAALESPAVTPMQMLSMAVSQNADLDKLQKLMDFQERWEASEAKKAFVAAMNEFKKTPPVIHKDKQVAFGQTRYKHAELDQVSGLIGKALSEVGISHRWSVGQAGEKIRVTCTLTHKQGHSESVTMEAPPDASGQKNSIQGIASTVTYLERYTLLAATGTATGEQDDDGAGGDGSTSVQFVLESKDRDECLERFGVEYGLAGKAKNQRLQRELIGARDQRLEALKKGAKP